MNLLYLFCGGGDWTQGFVHVKQVLYQMSYTPIPNLVYLNAWLLFRLSMSTTELSWYFNCFCLLGAAQLRRNLIPLDGNTVVFLPTHSSPRVKIAELISRVVTTELYLSFSCRLSFLLKKKKKEESYLMAVPHPYHSLVKIKYIDLLMEWSGQRTTYW